MRRLRRRGLALGVRVGTQGGPRGPRLPGERLVLWVVGRQVLGEQQRPIWGLRPGRQHRSCGRHVTRGGASRAPWATEGWPSPALGTATQHPGEGAASSGSAGHRGGAGPGQACRPRRSAVFRFAKSCPFEGQEASSAGSQPLGFQSSPGRRGGHGWSLDSDTSSKPAAQGLAGRRGPSPPRHAVPSAPVLGWPPDRSSALCL